MQFRGSEPVEIGFGWQSAGPSGSSGIGQKIVPERQKNYPTLRKSVEWGTRLNLKIPALNLDTPRFSYALLASSAFGSHTPLVK